MELTREKYIDAHTHNQKVDADNISVINLFPDTCHSLKEGKCYSIGLHPWYIPDDGAGKLLEIIEHMAGKEEVVAIGECGMDKFASAPLDVQQFVFEKQIEIAEKVHKPLIIHCVKSYNELTQIKNSVSSSVEWIVHGFNSKLQVADMLLRFEIFFSFGKALLNPNSNASKVISQIEDEVYLLETDDSNVSIQEIYQAAANNLHMDIETLKLSMVTNFINIFKI